MKLRWNSVTLKEVVLCASIKNSLDGEMGFFKGTERTVGVPIGGLYRRNCVVLLCRFLLETCCDKIENGGEKGTEGGFV